MSKSLPYNTTNGGQEYVGGKNKLATRFKAYGDNLSREGRTSVYETDITKNYSRYPYCVGQEAANLYNDRIGYKPTLAEIKIKKPLRRIEIRLPTGVLHVVQLKCYCGLTDNWPSPGPGDWDDFERGRDKNTTPDIMLLRNDMLNITRARENEDVNRLLSVDDWSEIDIDDDNFEQFCEGFLSAIELEC